MALFLAGFSTFSLLYCVQPLLPAFSRAFAVDAATSALALSVTTGGLAVGILVAGAVSHSIQRRGLMLASMVLSAVCAIVAAASPTWGAMLTARLLGGLALGGVPAVAMAYLAEEMRPSDLGKAVGLYVAGTAFGGMAGRVGMGVLAEFSTWRVALAMVGVLALASAAGFALLLPPSRNFVAARGVTLADHGRLWGLHLADPVLLRLFVIGFLLIGVYVETLNSTMFRLAIAPYGFGQAALSGVFIVTILGVPASAIAGRAVDRWGSYRSLLSGLALLLSGIAITWLTDVGFIIAGVAIINAGFFVGHTVVSGWVARRAQTAKGHSASLYLLFYYFGASVSGVIGGWLWHLAGWSGVAGAASVATMIAIGIGRSAHRLDLPNDDRVAETA